MDTAATMTQAIPIPAATPPDTWLAPALSPTTPGVDISDAEVVLVAVGSGVGVGAPYEESVKLGSRVACELELCGV